MKLGLDKPAAKKTMRVATVLTGMTAAAAAFAPAAAAKAAEAGNVTPDTTPGHWQLHVYTPFPKVFACEFSAGRTGKSCSIVSVYGYTATSSRSAGVFLYEGHIMLIWGWATSKKSFVLKGPGGHLSKQQYTVTAKPGDWNQCTLPAGGYGTYNVYAEAGHPNCLSLSLLAVHALRAAFHLRASGAGVPSAP